MKTKDKKFKIRQYKRIARYHGKQKVSHNLMHKLGYLSYRWEQYCLGILNKIEKHIQRVIAQKL